jgi:hypothetical protein
VTNTFTVKQTGTSTLQLHSSGGQENIQVGSYVQNGGSVYLINGYGGTSGGTTRIFTVTGSFTIDTTVKASIFSLSNGTGASTRAFTLNVGGNMSIGTGAILQADTAHIPNTSLVFNGAGAQALSNNGGTLGDEIINVNKASGTLSLGSNISVTNKLLVTAGQLVLGNYNVTLVSSSTNTASVAATTVTTPFTYGTGAFILQRYVPGKRAFRFFGHPFTNTLNLSSLTDNILITGGTGTGFTPSGTNAPSAFWYNPATGTEDLINDIGWTAFATADGSGGSADTWKQYEGIRVLVRGNIADGLSPTTPSAVTIDASGQLNVGTQTIPVTKGTNSGYNFIANPFASNINLTTVGGNVTLGSNMLTTYYLWDMSLGTKGGWDNRAFSTSYILPSFASFIVKTSAADNITIAEAAKSTSTATGSLYRTNSANPEMIRLWVTGNNINWDKFELYYDNDSKVADDKNDGSKFLNSEVNFYSIQQNNKNYSIDSRPFVKDDVIPLGFTSAVQQSYTIKASDYTLNPDVELYLRDKYIGVETLLAEGTEYTFSVTSDASSQGNNRFELVQKAAQLNIIPSFTIKLSPNPATDVVTITFNNAQKQNTNISMTSATGQKVKTIEVGNVQNGTLTINLKGLAKGVYYISLNGRDAQKLVVD